MTFSDFIDKVCRPDPNVIKSDLELEMTYKRNRNFLLFLLIGFLTIMGYSILNQQPLTPAQQVSLFLMTTILAVFLLTCRSYPLFFKTFYFTLITLSCPVMLNYNKDSVFFCFSSIYLVPTFTLYLVGIKPFLLQVIIQIFYLQKLLKPQLIESLEAITPEAYVIRIAKLITVTLVGNCLLILTMQMALVKAYDHVFLERSRKIELERQKTFFLSFSHELRNLVNTMIGTTQLCLLETLPIKVRDLLRNSEVCGELLMHLINNILDTGKVEIGELEINLAPNRIYDTLEKTWGVCSQLIEKKGLFGQMRIEKVLPENLKIDGYRLMQILTNLIGNAIKFTDRGKIKIDVQWIEDKEAVVQNCFEPGPFDDEDEGLYEKCKNMLLLENSLLLLDLNHKKIRMDEIIRKNTGRNKGVIKIIVSDTGCGIPKEKIPLLFKKFSQVSDDPAKSKLGTGLGLFITKELVRKMNGDIRPFSKVNKGTVFMVCFPAEIVLNH